MPLQLIVNNFNAFRRPKIIKKLPGLLRNHGDYSIVAIKYSVRNQFADDAKEWFLIRKERGDEAQNSDGRLVASSTSAIVDGSVEIYRSLLSDAFFEEATREILKSLGEDQEA